MGRPWIARKAPARIGVGVLAVLALALAACGDDDSDSGDGGGGAGTTATSAAGAPSSGAPTSAAAAPDDVDPEGVLRIGMNFASSGGIKFDPTKQNSPAEFQVHYHVYDTLLRQKEDGTYAPGLATEAKIVDPNTIEVTLQEGVTFQDGSRFDAEDVKATIERNVASENTSPFRVSELSAVGTIDVDSPTKLTIRLKTPTAGSFYNLLAHNETMPLSKEAIDSGVDLNENPIGAGPFKFVSQDAQRIVFEKWDGYFQADEIKVAGVEWVQTDAQSVVTALRSHAIDVAFTTPDQNQQLEGSGIAVRSDTGPNNVFWTSFMCEVQPLLRNVQVRRALNHAIDREAINATLFAGKGAPMSQFWAPGTDFYDPSLADMYPHDPERARQLLAEAGQEGLALRIAASPGQQQRAAELVQAQFAEAGINLEIVTTTNFVQEVLLGTKADLAQQPQNRFWTDKVTRVFMPGSVGTTCDPKDPVFTAMVADLRAVDPSSPRAIDLWHRVSRYLQENAYGLFMVNGTNNNAWDGERVAGIAWTPNQVGQPYPDMHSVYVKR